MSFYQILSTCQAKNLKENLCHKESCKSLVGKGLQRRRGPVLTIWIVFDTTFGYGKI